MFFGESAFAEITFAGETGEQITTLFNALLEDVDAEHMFLVELELRQLS